MDALPDRPRLGLDEHFVFQSEIARGGSEDRFRSDEYFLAACHCAAHIVLPLTNWGNYDGRLWLGTLGWANRRRACRLNRRCRFHRAGSSCRDNHRSIHFGPCGRRTKEACRDFRGDRRWRRRFFCRGRRVWCAASTSDSLLRQNLFHHSGDYCAVWHGCSLR